MSARARDLREAFRERAAGERGPAFAARGPSMAVVYPSPYRAGMSSLGFQRIVTLLRDAGVAAERAFLPDDPAAWRAAGLVPVTMETHAPLRSFPLLAVSFAYETELLGLIELLDASGIPPLRAGRTADHPLILVGGPITMTSPAFLAPFVDAMLFGEGEDVVVPAVLAAFDGDRAHWLDAIERLPGGWVPERHGMRLPVAAVATDRHLPARSAWLAPDAELSNMFLIEGERGCHRMCTFCVMRRTTNGGMRLVTPERVLGLVPSEATKVGLVGAAISDHPSLVELLDTLVQAGKQVSVSSLRADQIARRPGIARALRASGARTLTTASDGASERLRKSLRKGTTQEHLAACAEQAGAEGFGVFKLYMMIGVPTETDDDIDELVASTLALAAACAPSRLALGVAPFVAKRGTPLDGVDFAGIKVVERRMERLRRGLKGRAEVRPASARWAWVEHELAQGGPEAGLAMWEASRTGASFSAVRDALRRVDPETRRPWAAFEAPLVDPVVRRAS